MGKTNVRIKQITEFFGTHLEQGSDKHQTLTVNARKATALTMNIKSL